MARMGTGCISSSQGKFVQLKSKVNRILVLLNPMPYKQINLVSPVPLSMLSMCMIPNTRLVRTVYFLMCTQSCLVG